MAGICDIIIYGFLKMMFGRIRFMSLYYRNLKRIGIYTIVISILNLVYEMLLRSYLSGISSPFTNNIPLPWGIWTKNMIGVLAGLTALLFHLKKKHYLTGTVILALMDAAEIAVIILSTVGNVGRRTNGLIDITLLMMTLLTYTFSQTDRDQKRWIRVSRRDPETLDLQLPNKEDFFDPIQIGPKMAINQKYAKVINRYIASMKTAAPLQINLLCRQPVSEVMRDMMQEVYTMHYEAEENRVVKTLEKKYCRIMLLIAISAFAVGIVHQFTLFNEEMVVWEIIANFTAFGLWQIGYTHYERTEGYEELLLVHIAKYSKLCFIEKQ